MLSWRMPWTRRALLVASLIALMGCDEAGSAAPLAVGGPAPNVTFSLHDGKKQALADLRGQLVLVYFYPKDDTPG
jgi:peroxiredoxin Q/BCP